MPNNPHYGMSNDLKPGDHRLPPSAVDSNVFWKHDGNMDLGVHTIASEDVFPHDNKRHEMGAQPQAETVTPHRDHAIAIPTLAATYTTQHAIQSAHSIAPHTYIPPNSASALPPQQGTPEQLEMQRHCFKDAAGNQICRAISNYHHNLTDVHNDHGVSDFHNEYNYGHKDAFKGIVQGTNITDSFPQPGRETHVTGSSHEEGKTVFEGHKSASEDGFRDTHEDKKNGDFEDHKEDNTHNELDYKEASKHPTGGQGRTNVHGVNYTHKVNDVQDHKGTTDTLRQGSENWEFQLENIKDHGRGRPAEGQIADHPMNDESAPSHNSPDYNETKGSGEDTNINKHAGVHSDHVYDEHSGVDGTYDLHEEINEKDSTTIHVIGSDAFQDLNETLENMQDVFDDPAFKVESDSTKLSSGQPQPREVTITTPLPAGLGTTVHVVTIDYASRARHGSFNPPLPLVLGAFLGCLVLGAICGFMQRKRILQKHTRPRSRKIDKVWKEVRAEPNNVQQKEDV